MVIKSRRMKWAGHAAHIGGSEDMHTEFLWENVKGRDKLED